MRPSIVAPFLALTDKFEGRLPFLYLDVRGLVTTGCGFLCDPIDYCIALPWQRPDGSRASAGEITDAFHTVKAATSWERRGGAAFAPLTTIRLSDDGVDALTMSKMRSNDLELCQRFSGWETLPADVQLALHSLAWAVGPRFEFPKLEAGIEARDWMTCANECHLDTTGNPGLVPRNAAMDALFVSAAAGGDPTTVNGWLATSPNDVTTEPDLDDGTASS